MLSWPAWALWSLGGLLTAAGLALLLHSLFADRSRNRPRCPKCWYDLRAAPTPPLRCPECGRLIKHPRALFRTRRRYRRAALSLLILLLGSAAIAWPQARGGIWHRWLPSTALLACLPWIDDQWVSDELDRRIEPSLGPITWQPRDALWGWQWTFLRREIEQTVRGSTSGPLRARIFARLFDQRIDPNPAIDTIVQSVHDPERRVRFVAQWGSKSARYAFGPSEREQVLAALRATNEPAAYKGTDDRGLAIAALESVSAPPTLKAADLDPDHIARFLSGATSRELTAVHRALHLYSNVLYWPYDGESGPFRVDRYDLDLDDQPGTDCLLSVRDNQRAHGEAIVFLRRGDVWLCPGELNIANQPDTPPDFRAEHAPDGTTWLVVHDCRGQGGPYALFGESWLTVTAAGFRPSLLVSESGHERNTAVSARGKPLQWELESDPPTLSSDRGALTLQYTIRLHVSAAWSLAWNGETGPDLALAAADLFTRTTTIRFRWNSWSRKFEPLPGTPDWNAEDSIPFSILDTPDAFLTTNAAQFHSLARTATPAQRRWLELYLTLCKSSPARDAVSHALAAP